MIFEKKEIPDIFCSDCPDLFCKDRELGHGCDIYIYRDKDEENIEKKIDEWIKEEEDEY